MDEEAGIFVPKLSCNETGHVAAVRIKEILFLLKYVRLRRVSEPIRIIRKYELTELELTRLNRAVDIPMQGCSNCAVHARARARPSLALLQ